MFPSLAKACLSHKHSHTIVIFIKDDFWWRWCRAKSAGFSGSFMFLLRRLESFAFPLYFNTGSSFDTVWRVARTCKSVVFNLHFLSLAKTCLSHKHSHTIVIIIKERIFGGDDMKPNRATSARFFNGSFMMSSRRSKSFPFPLCIYYGGITMSWNI